MTSDLLPAVIIEPVGGFTKGQEVQVAPSANPLFLQVYVAGEFVASLSKRYVKLKETP